MRWCDADWEDCCWWSCKGFTAMKGLLESVHQVRVTVSGFSWVLTLREWRCCVRALPTLLLSPRDLQPLCPPCLALVRAQAPGAPWWPTGARPPPHREYLARRLETPLHVSLKGQFLSSYFAFRGLQSKSHILNNLFGIINLKWKISWLLTSTLL